MGRKDIKTDFRHLNPDSGFTLIELMVIFAIIATLGALIISALASQIFKGNDAKRKADLNRIQVALEEYEKDNNCYPPVAKVSCSPDPTQLLPYLGKVPCDPTTGQSYAYNVPNGCAWYYKLSAQLQNRNDPSYPTYTVTSPNTQ